MIPIWMFRPQHQSLVVAGAVAGFFMIAALWLYQLSVVSQARSAPPLLEYRSSSDELTFDNGVTLPASALVNVRIVRSWVVRRRPGRTVYRNLAQISCGFRLDGEERMIALHTMGGWSKSLDVVAHDFATRFRVPLERISIRGRNALSHTEVVSVLGTEWSPHI